MVDKGIFVGSVIGSTYFHDIGHSFRVSLKVSRYNTITIADVDKISRDPLEMRKKMNLITSLTRTMDY
ncbi:MAG: hypothetical protein ACTSVI_04870 [Promethearchaeota archaeon]